jgi:hypothetical protein
LEYHPVGEDHLHLHRYHHQLEGDPYDHQCNTDSIIVVNNNEY